MGSSLPAEAVFSPEALTATEGCAMFLARLAVSSPLLSQLGTAKNDLEDSLGIGLLVDLLELQDGLVRERSRLTAWLDA